MVLIEWIKEIYYSFFNEVYEGDTFNGKGTVYFRNGKIKYTGDWKNSVYHGSGKLYTYKGDLLYEGQFKEGVYHGQGTWYDRRWMRLNYDKKYIGSFKDGKKCGFGVIMDGNTKLFEGTFEADKLVNGKMYREDKLVFEGEFRDDCRYKGKLYIDDYVTLEGVVSTSYHTSNKTIGSGFLTTSDGYKYRTMNGVPYGDKM